LIQGDAGEERGGDCSCVNEVVLAKGGCKRFSCEGRWFWMKVDISRMWMREMHLRRMLALKKRIHK
jgi:hypothetical protein